MLAAKNAHSGGKMSNPLRSKALLSLLLILTIWNPALMSAADPGSPATPDGATAAAPDPAPNGVNLSSPNAVLLNLLVSKGILTTSEAASLSAATGQAGTQQLLLILKQKGVITDSDVATMQTAYATTSSDHTMADTQSADTMLTAQMTNGSQTVPAKPKEASPGPTVIPAIAPLRVVPSDPPAKGSVEGISLGAVKMRPYGFVKATMAYDSSDPRGDDFIVPGFLNSDTGPNKNPEFHIKARATRMGSRFEWPDMNGKMTITGQIEADYEGNFSRADNRNVSSIRSNALQLRLAYGRIDYAASDKTDVFFEAGQDWTIFGSSALMNLFETTFFGAYWGNIYERSPQFKVGFVQKLGGSRNFKFTPEFAIMMPSDGVLPADSVTCTVTKLDSPTSCTFVNGLGNQLGYGERQGADSAEPEYEARTVLQFQLDKAPGVVPAQILWSGFYSHRQATVLGSAVPTAFKGTFPTGVDVTTPGYGNQVAVSLPTRWVTVVASGYMGADMRFFFGDQLNSVYTYSGGLTGLATGPSVDGASTITFGTNAQGQQVVAPQRPVRDYGGFVQVGMPLSRWFNADPKGRNAGWQAYLEYGLDASNAADFRKAKNIGANGAGPIKSNLKGLTLFYKLNPYVQFGFEESQYQSYAVENNKGVCTTLIAGKPNCTSTDWRTEFGPIFTF
jgi:hypothetical protein